MDGFTEMLEIGKEMQEKEKKMKISMEEKSKKVEINIIANLERKEERLTVSNFLRRYWKSTETRRWFWKSIFPKNNKRQLKLSCLL